MTTFTAQQKKDLEPLSKRVATWNAALDDVSDNCTCVASIEATGSADPTQCPAIGHTCLGTTVASIRINMNLIRLAHSHLSDADLNVAVRALGDLFAGLSTATSSVAFANDLLTRMRHPKAFNEDGSRR
jgi:hypothetical protein